MVEATLCQVPGVVDAVVYGRPNPLVGFLVAADIVVDPRFDAAQVLDNAKRLCQQRLSRHETPRIVQVVNAIDIGETGKKLRRR
jgi:acyl-coenzyme A synthetase/AMP-(fatty) acid ligase